MYLTIRQVHTRINFKHYTFFITSRMTINPNSNIDLLWFNKHRGAPIHIAAGIIVIGIPIMAFDVADVF